jgi:hypothetical protein
MPILNTRGTASAKAFGLTANAPLAVDYLIVAGGGGGGTSVFASAGGAGAGGLLTGATRLTPNTSYTITVGGGGGVGIQGTNSSGLGVTATGGGHGGGNVAPGGTFNGGNGGSGVVILKYPDTYTITIGAGLTGSTASPSGGFKVSTITAGTGNVSWA